MTMLSGMCLCETVQYTVEDAFEYAFNCHCSKCRRTTGSAFKPIAGIPFGKVRLIAGDAHILRVGDPAETHDSHCALCGSFLYSYIADNGYAHVGMGSLMDAPSIRPSHHIFVGFKAPWYDITDNLPQYAEFPTD